jgi:predicted GH43/DUF377 family glycosyl hydrolase
MKWSSALLWVSTVAGSLAAAPSISEREMQAVYEEVKTPHKVGLVLEPRPGYKVDCANVFRQNDRWWMVYVQLEPAPKVGYTTQLAASTNLLHWTTLGQILDRGPEGAWDHANSGGGLALVSTEWGRPPTLEKHDGRYWMCYLGGPNFGYEAAPFWMGVAFSEDPTRVALWTKSPKPILTTTDADVRVGERYRIFKPFVFHDPGQTLGAPYVMFYNAQDERSHERIFRATSKNMTDWQRYGTNWSIANDMPAGAKGNGISGDPQIVRMKDLWVMFYFGAFWKPGAFDTFACSRDLEHWTKWTGPDLIKASEPWDSRYAHKPWVFKHEGIVYHFYTAVDEKDHRAIALATSRPVKP